MQLNAIRKTRFHFFTIAVMAVATAVQAADYTWTGNGANGNWNNKTNWSSSNGGTTCPTTAVDNAWFSNPVASANVPTLSAAATANVVTLSGPTNWTIGGANLLFLNGGLNHASVYTNVFAPKLAGSFGIAITSGVLVLSNTANLYTGNTTITGGVLDVSAAAFNTNSASAAGSNANPVVLGDLNAGLDAELRLGNGGNRGVTAQGGAGGRTIRFTGSKTYTGTYTLNGNTIFAPGYLTDPPGVNTTTINSQLTGTGGVAVANGAGIIVIGNTNNNYTGQTKILAGTLQLPSAVLACTNILGYPQSYGTNALLLGDLGGTNNATLQLAVGANTTFTNNFPLHVQAGSSGLAALSIGDGTYNINGTFCGQFTIDKTLDINLLQASGTTLNLTNVISGPGGLNIRMAKKNAFKVNYCLGLAPSFTGGTALFGLTNGFTSYTPAQLLWQYPGNTGDNLLLRFGSNPDGSPSTITLNGGQFVINPTASGINETYTNDNPIVVPTNSNAFYYPGVTAVGPALVWGFNGTNGTVYFTGPIALGSFLELGDYGSINNSGTGHYQGQVTLDQVAAGRRGFLVYRQWNFNGCTLDGNIVDGAGAAANSLLLRYVGRGYGYQAPYSPLNITGTGSRFANGTVVEGDYYATANTMINVTSASGSLGLGNLWLLEGGWLRLNQSSHLHAGAGATVYGNQAAMSVLGVGANFLPALTPDSSGVLAIDTTGYDKINNQAVVGNGYMYLGSISGGTLTSAALAPCPDHVYRLGGGGGTLTNANGTLAGPNNTLQVGAPCGIAGANTGGGGYGTVVLSAANTYSGTTVNANSTLQGTAQTSGSPFGNSAGGVTLNAGTLYLSGATAPATNAIGALTVNGFGNVTVNQANTSTNTLKIASLPAQASSTPWVAILRGSSATTLGSKERIVITNGAPAVANGMVAPYLIYGNGPDFLTYNTNVDVAGVTGFANASSAYSNVATAAILDTVPSTGIANVTNSITLANNDNVYALRLGANSINTNGLTAYTITVGSGGVLLQPNSSFNSVYGNLSFSNAAGVICSLPNNSTYYTKIFGAIQGTNGLTLAGGLGLVYLCGNNNALTGTIAMVSGKIVVTNEFNLGALSNPICLNGGTLDFNASANDSRSIVVGPSGGVLQNDATLTVGGAITGPGCLFLTAGGTSVFAITNGNNTYSGGTFLSAGPNNATPFSETVTVASNATLGVGDVTVAACTALLCGDNNIGGGDTNGNKTTSRQARLSVEPYGSVYFISANPSVGSLSGSGNVWFTNTTTTLTMGGDNSSTLFDGILNQVAPGTGQLVKTGAGSFTFKGMSTLTGTTVVNGGTFVADGSMNGGITVNGGATLAGAGSVGAVTLNPGATFLPGVVYTNAGNISRMTTLSASSLAFSSGAAMTVNVYGPTNYTQIIANGPVNFGGAALQVNFLYKPAASDIFYILLNNSTSGTTGAFAGIPEGAQVALGNGYYGKVSYVATGDATAGNDVKIYNVTFGVAGTAIFFR